MIKSKYLNGDSRATSSISDEIEVMKMLDHPSCVRLIDEGTDGKVTKASGRVIDGLTYIVMEHVRGETLFDFQEALNEGNGMGESFGRFLMHQMLAAVEHIHGQGIVHRDIKPENILIDEHMRLKLLDFGFATTKNIDQLTSYRGTQSYMAPEIKKGLVYEGRQVDIFSVGVVLFSLVRGLFPFGEAKSSDYWYSLIRQGNFDQYFSRLDTKGNLSPEFKDLITAIFAEDGERRPTIAQIKAHPWMQMEQGQQELVRKRLQAAIASKRQIAPPSPLCDQVKKGALNPREASESFSSKTQAIQQQAY